MPAKPHICITQKNNFMIKKIYVAISLAFLLSGCEVLQNLPTSIGGVTENEAAQGIKEALGQGLAGAVLQLNTTDGFFKDALYKVLLPPDAKKIENTLERGNGKYCRQSYFTN